MQIATSLPIWKPNTGVKCTMTTAYTLDAWAVLALLQKEEPAASRVRALLEQARRGEANLSMSIVNLGEVYYRVGKVKGEAEADTTLAQLRQLAITVASATDAIVLAAATLKLRHPISYADAFAVATAASVEAILVTGDPELDALAASHRIEKLSRA